MLPNKTIEKLIRILNLDIKRAEKMHLQGFPATYFCSLLLRDTEWFNTWARGGSVVRRKADHTRNILCDLRVGSYKYDQVMNGGLDDNSEENESYDHVTVPIDDTCYDGLRLSIWRLLEAKYREAVSDFTRRRHQALNSIDQNKNFVSFTKLPAIKHIEQKGPENVNEEYWVKYCREASRWISKLPGVVGGWVEFDAMHVTKIFVNSEGSIIVQHEKVFSLIATMRNMSKEGASPEQDLVFNCGTQKEMPDMRTLKKLLRNKYKKLISLSRTKKIPAFSGPALLYPLPAGILLHEAFGHRLEGSRLLSSYEGRTFEGQIGKKILDAKLTIKDNPRQKKFRGQVCIGSYDYDDEGTPAANTLLVQDGILEGFLSTRASYLKKGFKPNGHARSKKHERAISRMGVFMVESSEGKSLKELRKMLIEEIKAQGKPYGIIIYESNGGETGTTHHEFQGFQGEIAYATIIYPNAKEVTVSGLNFVGTPLQALNNIMAIGDEQEINNSYCGAESGFIPITTISPAILLNTLELQARGDDLTPPFILPRPRTS
ncbi:MAG: metallopeptidase TldD-related protein [bacterium]|nr:metallopeptidase TldD-related protein [bacterium]